MSEEHSSCRVTEPVDRYRNRQHTGTQTACVPLAAEVEAEVATRCG